MKFSVITPIYLTEDRQELFYKCLESINNQTFKDFEYIIVDDGSPIEVIQPDIPNCKVIRQANLQRMTAYNTGFEEANGDYICCLDSDDEYESNYLEKVAEMFDKNSEYKMVNFGNTMIYPSGTKEKRPAFKPKELEVGHESFGGGNIVNGTFVFHRSIYEEIGAFPEFHLDNVDCTSINYPAWEGQPEPYIRDLQMTSPYDFSAWFQLKYPETQKYFMVKHPDHPRNLVKELGNPYGNDYALFYMYTRVFKSKPFDEYLLNVHLRV